MDSSRNAAEANFYVGPFLISETSCYISIHQQHDWDYLCLNGASQLHSLCDILCVTGNLILLLET